MRPREAGSGEAIRTDSWADPGANRQDLRPASRAGQPAYGQQWTTTQAPVGPVMPSDSVSIRTELLQECPIGIGEPAPALDASEVTILGGVRSVGLRVVTVEPDAANPLRLLLFLDAEGDFSTYVLALEHGDLDPERSEARFGFKAGCPTEFDCRAVDLCVPDPLDEPDLDYLAKDYQSFRRLFLDLIAVRNPDWTERLPADFSVALVEMLAYVGDYLSYLQDAGPATESFFEICLHRVSMQRHARLIDYTMHDGRNAATFVQFDLEPAPDPPPPPAYASASGGGSSGGQQP